MAFAICTVSIMPVRIVSDDRAEMVTQALFGEALEVLEMSSNWAYVRLEFDRYKGWVDTKQFRLVDEREMKRLKDAPMFYSSDLVQVLVSENSKEMITLTKASHLPGLQKKRFCLADKEYLFEGNVVERVEESSRKGIIEQAMSYLNAPYLWGGKNPFGIDCSGFTQMVYKLNGISIARDASQQAQQGEAVNLITDALVGDLAFFDNHEGKIIHVGILLGDNKIIHASGKVRIDAIDHQGIFNVETQKYSHKLSLIKGFL